MEDARQRDHTVDSNVDVNSHEDATWTALRDLDAVFAGLTFRVLEEQLIAWRGIASSISLTKDVEPPRDGNETGGHVHDADGRSANVALQRCLTVLKGRVVGSYAFRVLVGYDALVWHDVKLALGAAADAVFTLVKPGEDGAALSSKESGPWLAFVRDAVFVARGMLGGECVPQELAAATGVDGEIWNLLRSCLDGLHSENADADADAQEEDGDSAQQVVLRDIAKLCLQFVNNLLIDNESRKIAMWQQLFPMLSANDKPQPALSRSGLLLQAVAVLRGDELLPLAAILRMYIDPELVSTAATGSELQHLRSQALLQNGDGRDLLSELLGRAGSTQDRSGARTQAVVVEIVRCLLHWNLFVDAYEACGGSGTISDGQEFLLRCLTWAASDEIEQQDGLLGKAFLGEPVDSEELVLLPQLGIVAAVEYLVDILQNELSLEFLRTLDFQKKVITGTSLGGEKYILDFSGLEIKVKAFAELFGALAQDAAVRSVLVRQDVTQTFVALLGNIETTIPKLDFKGIIKGTGALKENAPEMLTNVSWGKEPLYMWPDLKSSLVSTIGSLVSENRASQDAVRESGGIELILNCCRYDQNNPMLKEFAIVALKFLLANNEQNQQVVRDLQNAQQSLVVPDDIADKIPLSAHNLALNP